MSIAESWKTYLKAQEYAPNTVESYVDAIEELLGFFKKEPVDITADDIESWMLAHQSWAPSTKNMHNIAVRNFFKYLINKRLISDDPSTILPPVKMRKRINESVEPVREDRVYSPEQLIALIEYNNIRFKSQLKRDRAIIALMAASGLRASEVGWLKVGQIRHRDGDSVFALRKGQNILRVAVSAFAFPYIDEYLAERGNPDDDEPLFTTRVGNAIDRHTIYQMLKVRQDAFNLKTGAHNIRYTVINAVERTANPVVARDVASHRSITTTNHYLISSNEERETVMANLPWAERLKK